MIIVCPAGRARQLALSPVLVTWVTLRGPALGYPQRGQQLFQRRTVQHQAAALAHHVLDLVKTAKKAHFDGGVFFGFGKLASMVCSPAFYRVLRDKQADRE